MTKKRRRKDQSIIVALHKTPLSRCRWRGKKRDNTSTTRRRECRKCGQIELERDPTPGWGGGNYWGLGEEKVYYYYQSFIIISKEKG